MVVMKIKKNIFNKLKKECINTIDSKLNESYRFRFKR